MSKGRSDLVPGLLFSAFLTVALLLVRLQVPYPGESLATHNTAIWFLSGVNSLVFPQVPGLGEHLPTCGAAEGLLPRVDALVNLHLLGAVKRFAAVAANEQPFLGGRSTRHFAAVAEGLGRGESGVATVADVNAGRRRWEIGRCHRV